MSHEIRTPMNGVIGMAGLLNEITDLPDDARQYSSLLKQSAENLLTIINDILDLSKLEAGRLEIEPVDFPSHPSASRPWRCWHRSLTARDSSSE